MVLSEQEEFELLSLERERSFQQTPGGAVTGMVMPPRTGPGTSGGLATIAGATGLGAAAGAVAPEILTGLAGLVRQIPQGARVAPWLESAAIAAKTAGRPTGAAFGAMSGFGAETAGQIAEETGAGPLLAEGVRFVAGGITPEVVPLAKVVLDVFKRKIPVSFEAAVQKRIALEIAAKLEGRPQDLSQREADFLNKLVTDLRGAPKSEMPASGIYNLLERGAQKKLATGQQQAEQLLTQAEHAAKREIDETLMGPIAASRAGAERLRARGQDALATAQLQRYNIGDDVDLSDIGGALRQTIVSRNQASILARRSEFKADEIARDAIVKAKEAKRIFVNSLPEYESLVGDLTKNLTPGRRSPDVQRSYAKILSEIQNPEKDIFLQRKPVSFQVLDDVRRRLGEVFGGKPAEGYEAISAADARKYYAMISNIQKKFGGEPQERILKHYADASEGLEMFGSKAGKRLTALDRYDDTRFQTDASALPRQFFNSKQGVQDLIELSGDRALVLKAAKDFVTNELRNLDSTQVQAWMTKRRELLSALPEIRNDVVRYSNILSRGENIATRTETAMRKHETFQRERIRASERSAAERTRIGEGEAGRIRTEASREAATLMGKEYPVERVRVLIESGDPAQWRLAAPEIMAAPGGKQILVESVRQVLADKASRSTTGLSEFYSRKVRPALEHTGVMAYDEIEKIGKQLILIENMKLPEQQKLGLARRFVLQSFGGLAASIGARAGVASASSLMGLIPQ